MPTSIPPFLTGKQHSKVTRRRAANGKIQRQLTPAFDDRWPSLGEYLSALGERIEQVRQLLASNGCMVLHVDPKTSHYAKVLCDEIFGSGCFASEIHLALSTLASEDSELSAHARCVVALREGSNCCTVFHHAVRAVGALHAGHLG